MFSRPTTALITSSFLLAILVSVESFACTCLPTGPPCQEFWSNAAVFVGRANSADHSGHRVRTTFDVVEPFRGITGTVVDIFSSESGASCGYSFETGALYIVYAHYWGNKQQLWTYSCSRTQRFSENSPDVAYARSVGNLPSGATILGAITRTIEDGVDWRGSGLPLAGIKVSIKGKGRDVTTVTDATGKYSVGGLPAGDYTIKPALPEGMDAGPAAAVSLSDRGCAEVAFLARWNGKLSGTVIDRSGHVVTGVGIMLVSVKRPDEIFGKIFGTSVVSDDDGRYQLSFIPPGSYLIRFSYLGIRPDIVYFHPGVTDLKEAEIVSLGEGEVIRGFTLRLPTLLPHNAITGTVVDQEGQPLRGVLVHYEHERRYFDEKAMTDDRGHFTFNAYEGVRYWVMGEVPKGNGEFWFFRRIELPEDLGNKPLRIVVDTKHYQASITNGQ